MCRAIATREDDAGLAAQAREAGHVLACEGFFEPAYAVDGELPAKRRTVSKGIGSRTSPGMRQAWFRSTMISIVAPTAPRTAATVATPCFRVSGSTGA